MQRILPVSRSVAVAATASTMLLAPAAAGAQEGTSEVRFLHASPSVGSAEFSADGEPAGSAGFGRATPVVEIEGGNVELRATLADGASATATQKLVPGRDYTVVAQELEDGIDLRAYPEGKASGGEAGLRVIHAAPELGTATIRAGDRKLADELSFRQATSYATVAPGTYQVSARDPSSGERVASAGSVAAPAGTTTTAVMIGSRGRALRGVALEDSVAAPSGAPQAGLGGLGRDDGPPLALAALAALAAGALGGLGYRRLRRASA